MSHLSAAGIRSRSARLLLAFVVSMSLVLSLLEGAAGAAPLKCRRAIAKASSKYVEAMAAALQKCEDDVLKGRTVGPCPDGRTFDRIARAQARLRTALERHCGGVDRLCGAGSGDEPLGAIGWDLAECPGLMGDECVAPIADCSDVAACLTCAIDRGTDELRRLFYDDLSRGNTDRNLNQCQRTIGKSATRFARTKVRVLARCQDALLGSRIPGPCPDGRATTAIARAENKMTTKICRACGGPNRACGDGDDLAVALVGARAACPAVTVPDGPACGGPITDVRTLLRCVDCLSQFTTTCLDRLAVPGLAAYPDECKENPDGAAPTATPGGGTPAPTPTAPTPTSTGPTPTGVTPTPTGAAPTPSGTTPTDATPTQTAGVPSPSPTPLAVCNNGILDVGEVCDFPDVGCDPGEVCAGCAVCQPAPTTCLNGTLDAGEVCEFPDVGCAAGELCASCLSCLSTPTTCGNGAVDAGEACDGDATCAAGETCAGCITCLLQPTTCLNGTFDAGEACETLTNEGCAGGEVCVGCATCTALPAACGNGALDAGETCELDGSGCDSGDVCAGCLTCVAPPTDCANGTLDPGETCDLPNLGCGALQVCELCQSCVGL
jgi:hypothetical protein